jgi:glucans biosynthesis protein C
MNKERVVYMDNIKIFLTCLVVAHHAAQAYGPTGGVWPVEDAAKIPVLKNFFFINAAFMMGLYFFISGYFMMFSIKRKTTGQFISDRLKRLGIPLVFFTVFLFLPFNYIGSDKSQNILSFFSDSYFNKPPLATGHLWFVASLLVYSFIYILIHRKRNNSETTLKHVVFKVWYIPVYIVLLTILSAIVRLKYPIDTWRTWIVPVEVAHIPQYISLFFIGTLFNRYQWLHTLKVSTGISFFAISIAVFVLHQYLPHEVRFHWLSESFIETILCVGISVGLLTVFRYFANSETGFTRLLSDNTYGIYMVHLFLVIVMQQLFQPLEINGWLKFTIVTFCSILLSMLVSVLLRKIKIVRTII